jgi:outer membrane protein assembly factor BamB
MSVHVVSSIATRDLGSLDARIGDLDGDGAPDLLFTQSIFGTGEIGCTREICCLTATTISGEVLWQTGEPAVKNGCWGDLPVQIFDWDNDGENEVVYVRQAVYAEMYPGDAGGFRGRAKRYEGTAALVVLNGRTGQEKTSFPIPAPADYSITFADLTGRGRQEDLVIKDAWDNLYGVSHNGEFLWQWHGGPLDPLCVPDHNLPHDPKVSTVDEKCHACHYPAVADVDGDGRDEVFLGFALLDHDGQVLFRKDCDEGVHSDANSIVRLSDGTWRLLFGNHGVHCLTVDGTELWHNPLVYDEAQHVVVGEFRSDSQLQVAVIDRGFPRTPDGGPGCLYLFDVETGEELWRRPQPPGSWCAACTDIQWRGRDALKEMLVYKRGATEEPIAIYDGQGNMVDGMNVPTSMHCTGENLILTAGTEDVHYCRRADLWGDSREEVIAVGRNEVRIYANARPLAVATLYNQTVYHGM